MGCNQGLGLAPKGLPSRRKTRNNEIDDKRPWFSTFKITKHLWVFFSIGWREGKAKEPRQHLTPLYGVGESVSVLLLNPGPLWITRVPPNLLSLSLLSGGGVPDSMPPHPIQNLSNYILQPCIGDKSRNPQCLLRTYYVLDAALSTEDPKNKTDKDELTGHHSYYNPGDCDNYKGNCSAGLLSSRV